MKIIAWLLGGGRIGKWIVTAGMGALFLLLGAYNKGRDTERSKAAEKKAKNILQRIKIDDKISKMPPSDRRRELAKWVQ